MMEALAVDGLGFRYPGGHGFWDISFTASYREVVCIFGRNGSGKTTLFRVLSTLTPPGAGRFSVRGSGISADREDVRREIFPVFDTSAHFDQLSGRENILLFLSLYGISPLQSPDELAAAFELELDRKAGEFSLGMKRKLSLIESLLCPQPVLFFDEPTLGLDSAAQARFFSLVRRAADQGSCVIIFTNRIEDTLGADRLFRLENGNLARVATAEELLEGMIRVTLYFPDHEVTEYIPTVSDLPDLVRNALAGGTLRKIEISEGSTSSSDTGLWTDEARQKVERAPRFLRGMITTLVERHAREAGYARITPEVVEEVRGRFERQ